MSEIILCKVPKINCKSMKSFRAHSICHFKSNEEVPKKFLYLLQMFMIEVLCFSLTKISLNSRNSWKFILNWYTNRRWSFIFKRTKLFLKLLRCLFWMFWWRLRQRDKFIILIRGFCFQILELLIHLYISSILLSRKFIIGFNF